MYDAEYGGGFSCGWPYPHHDAKPADVTSKGAAITGTADSISSVATSVETAHRPAVGAVAGSIEQPTATLPQPVIRDAGQMAAGAMVVGGCVTRWGQYVSDHNGRVDGLNNEFSTEHDNDFGVAAADYSDAKTADERSSVTSARSGRVDAQHRARAAVFQRRFDALVEEVRADGNAVATLMDKGPTDSVILQLLTAGALPPSALTMFPGVKPSDRNYQTMMANLRKYGGLNAWLTGGGCQTSAQLKAALDAMRAGGADPTEYADLLQKYYLTKACEKAGIDLCNWDTSKGADANLANIIASYEYYGKLYLDNPDLQWAGMAGMIGPTFAGGMFDLQMLKQLSDIVSGPLDAVPDWAKGAVYGALPSPLDDLAVLGEMGEHEFAYFEEKLLSMQKQIFTDQMPMHEAYLESGTAGIQEMYDAGLIDQDMRDAWDDIDSGDTERVQDGNAALLRREQQDIIGDDYDAMRDYHGPVGETMTYMMGAIGAPGIPGAQSLGEYDPQEFGVSIDPWGPGPHGSVEVETPFPDGNISDFDTRWDLIENDTLPAFQDLVQNDPQQVEDILNGDVQDRIDDARLGNNIDDIIGRLSNWDINVDGGLW